MHVDCCPGQRGHQSSGGTCSAYDARSILCDRSVLANLRRADGFGGGLVGCQLLSLEQHRSVVLPQVSAGSVDRSCWRASVRFSVSLRVGSSGLLGDLAGDPGLHPADERDKVLLATKTLGAAWWRAASRITALSHIGRSACGLAIVFVLVPVTSAAGRGYRWWTNLLGLAVKIRQIDHFWKVVNRVETGAARKGAGSQRFNASEFLIAPSCNRGQTHAFCLQIPSVRLTEQVACSKPNLDLEQSNKATCPHFFFPFRRGLGRNRSQDHTATCSLFWGSKKHALGPWPCCARCEKCRL